MKFPKISASVPEGEHFDESAVNEGVWISQNHLTAIENTLAGNETAAAEAATSLETANASIATLTEQLTAEKTSLATLTAAAEASAQKITELETTIASNNAASETRIKELEEEVKALGKQPSGSGSAVTATEDEIPDEAPAGKPSLMDADHPLNQYATSKIAHAEKVKKNRNKF